MIVSTLLRRVLIFLTFAYYRIIINFERKKSYKAILEAMKRVQALLQNIRF